MNIEEFKTGIDKLGLTYSQDNLDKLEQYYKILVEENKYMNLTGITEKTEVYLKHFYDSLTIIKVINLKNINNLCDLGTGAGFPGLVIAIMFPNLKVSLVDSLTKRCNFLQKVVDSLNLTNVKVIDSRCEEYASKVREHYDVVTARAVAKLDILLEYSIPLLKVNGLFIPLKANVTKEELMLDNYYKKLGCLLVNKEEFLLPFENSLRTILVFKKESKTNIIYPRSYDKMKKIKL